MIPIRNSLVLDVNGRVIIVVAFLLAWATAGNAQTIHITPENSAVALDALRHTHERISVSFAAGTYYLSRPIEISGAEGIVLQPDPGASVILSGGDAHRRLETRCSEQP